jgi:antitoxin (DNA-binding transcriptional repressor) of toxin-antitoxin stability system
MSRIPIEDAQRRLAELIATSVPGEEIEIVQEDRVIAKLVPVVPQSAPRHPGSAKGSILYMAPDFDGPLEDFQEYME